MRIINLGEYVQGSLWVGCFQSCWKFYSDYRRLGLLLPPWA